MAFMFDALLCLCTAPIFTVTKLIIGSKNILYALELVVFSTTRANVP